MDEAAAELTRRWLEKAAADLAAARIIADAAEGPLATALYHCQQAAEKSVKAYLISRDEPFAKTHEIEPLVRKAAQFERRFLEFAPTAARLTPFAWMYRYPSELSVEEPKDAEVREALQDAHAIYEFVLSLLPAETHP